MDDDRIILMRTSAKIEIGHRVGVDPTGAARLAAADESEIGVAVTNGAGGSVIVRLAREPLLARVAGPMEAGKGLARSADGSWIAVKSGAGQAVALEPVATKGVATIRILPNA